MPEYGKLDLERVPVSVHEASVRAMGDYSVSLLLNHQLRGSGTFVSAGGKHGILTAHHVADLFTKQGKSDIGINIRHDPHALHVAADAWDCISLGRPAWYAYTDVGPDLAFLHIRDPLILGTIKSVKSFWPLNRETFSRYESEPYQRFPYWIAGAPQNFCMNVANKEHPSTDSE